MHLQNIDYICNDVAFVESIYPVMKTLSAQTKCKDILAKKGILTLGSRKEYLWDVNDLFGIALDLHSLKHYTEEFQMILSGNQRKFQNFGRDVFENGWNSNLKIDNKRNMIKISNLIMIAC